MKDYKLILLFGFLLAFLAALLQVFEYKYFIGRLDTSVYTSVVATIFTIVGVWVGMNILKAKNEKPETVVVTVASTPSDAISEENLKALNLNDREYEILQLIAQGRSNKEIAGELFLAIPTIKTHISNLYSKMEVRSRTQAVHKAREIRIL